MTKLKLSAIEDEKLVKVTVTLSGTLHRTLVAYAEILARDSRKTIEPAKLIPPMLERFIASDRGFAQLRRDSKDARPASLTENEPNKDFS